MKISLSAAAVDTETKEKNSSPSEGHRQESPARYPHHHCQPLKEIWEEMDPGSIPFGYSGSLHAPELPQVVPAFPPGAQSLVLAVT